MNFKRITLFAVLAFAVSCFAQAPTPPVTTTLPGYSVQLAAGYSYITNATTNNGFFSTIDVPLYHDKSNAFAISGVGNYFSISNPSSYYVSGGPTAHFQYSKPSLLNGQVFEPFAGVGFGVTRSVSTSTETPSGAMHFGFDIHGGLDTILKGNVSWRIVQVAWIHSTLYPGGSVAVSNIGQVTTGIGIRF